VVASPEGGAIGSPAPRIFGRFIGRLLGRLDTGLAAAAAPAAALPPAPPTPLERDPGLLLDDADPGLLLEDADPGRLLEEVDPGRLLELSFPLIKLRDSAANESPPGEDSLSALRCCCKDGPPSFCFFDCFFSEESDLLYAPEDAARS
jgi:hypothetical protein